jgi:inner membrane transporter RhtA
MVVGSVTSVQGGAALATTLFAKVGPEGAVFLRTLFAAAVLLVVARGSLPSLRGRRLGDLLGFAIAFAGMNLLFYAALDRLPLGIAVTIEFIGPLGVAVFSSRRRRDVVWALLAAAGILLLSGGVSGEGVDATGALLALLAGGFWAAYILQAARVGGRYPGLGGLAVAMAISTLLVAPFGISQGGATLLHPAVLAAGCAVGILSSAIPYALELEALRRLPNSVFGVLMSIEPAIAALVGFIALSQGLAAPELVAIGLVVAASAGALRSAGAAVPRDG